MYSSSEKNKVAIFLFLKEEKKKKEKSVTLKCSFLMPIFFFNVCYKAVFEDVWYDLPDHVDHS